MGVAAPAAFIRRFAIKSRLRSVWVSGRLFSRRSCPRRLEHLECRFEPVGEAVGEPIIINVNFVDKDLKVVDQMQLTIRGTPERRSPASATLPILVM